MEITIVERPGECRWCGCDHDHPCESVCGWANAKQTLCTACVNLDRSMRSKAGRAKAVELFNAGEDAAALAHRVAPGLARRKR